MSQSAEDGKLLTLARSARARTRAPSAAAVRDETGRTYVGVDVALPTLRLSALQLCVAQAVAGGSTGLEAAAVVTTVPDTDPDLEAVADLGGPGIDVLVADPAGRVVRRVST